MVSVTEPPAATVRLTADELLFDMDGTLIDSIAAVESAWRVWAAEQGVVLAAGASFHGRTAVELVASLVPAERFDDALRRLEELERVPAVPVVPLPGALDLLEQLPPGSWALVTSAARSVALARLASAGVPVPPRFISADDVEHGKPAPEPFLAGRGVEGPAIAFEDTVAGLVSARAAGCTTVGIIGTYPADVMRPYADLLVKSLADVSVVHLGGAITLEIRTG